VKGVLERSKVLVALAAAAPCLVAGCGVRYDAPPVPPGGEAPKKPASEIPQVEPRLCTAVVVLLDASSSMNQRVRGNDGAERPKHVIAREALERIIDQTAAQKKKRPDLTLQLGILQFSSSVEEILPMAAFDADTARGALGRIRASSGTAIGRGLAAGFRALLATGCVRKHVICITDGENTSGPSPDAIARDLHGKTGGEVAIHFVAFDTSARHFGFLEDVGGSVVEAADGAELDVHLLEIYSKRILAEAMPEE
jgi:Mg-chelatase subunit ChlD